MKITDIRIDSAENWAKAVNFIPKKTQLIIYSDLNKMKIGDGKTNVQQLSFVNEYKVENNTLTL